MAEKHTAGNLSPGAREAWLARFAALEAFAEDHARLPDANPHGGPEDTLHSWLIRQRREVYHGRLPRGLELLLDSIPGALPAVRQREQVPAVPLPPGTEKRVKEVRDFAARNGFLPRRSAPSAEERRLNEYLYTHLERRLPDTPKGEARREALLTLARAYPTRRESLTAEVLEAAEQYVAVHGHLPVRSQDPALEKVASWVARTADLLHAGRLDVDVITRARIKALLAYPTKKDVDWNRSLDRVLAFTASHAGRPPTANEDRPLYGWLHRQHKLYRDGTLPAERDEKLSTLPGFGSGQARPAA